MVSLSQAKKLVKFARDSISAYFDNKIVEPPEDIKEEFKEKKGVFVSVYVKGDLAGCIGFPEPIFELWLAVRKAAVSAAFKDPRFPPLMKNQFKDLRIELTVLTKPEVIEVKDPKQYLRKIKIGKDGLMVKDEFGSGLLLPQVAVEWGWNVEEFLNQTCVKAGLDPDCWRNTKRNVFKFQGQLFTEEKGKLVEKKLY
jgi:hypothetical protein